MTVQLNISDVILQPELNAAQITITPIFSSGVPDVNKQYVDEGLDLKVDKVEGKGLSTENYTTAEKSKVANVPLNTNTELAAKVDKVEGKSLVDNSEIDKLAEYPELENLEFSHADLTDKNSEAAFQHVDTTVTKDALDEADKVALFDSVTGKMMLTPKSNFNKDNLLVDYTHSGNKEINVISIDFATSTITSDSPPINGFYVAIKNTTTETYPLSILPNNLNLGVVYYPVNLVNNTFQLSLSSNGSPIIITDKATRDFSKWHFEERSARLSFTNIQPLNRCKITTYGKCFESTTFFSYLIFKKSGNEILGGSGTNWLSTGGLRYTNSTNARPALNITNLADVYSQFNIEVDFSKQRAEMILSGVSIRSASESSLVFNNVSQAIWVHRDSGNAEFDEILIDSVFNGFNIKIYEIK